MFRAFLLLIWLFLPLQVLAHPVTYEDGYVLMNSYHPERNDFHFHYSFTPRAAFGFNQTTIFEDEDGQRSVFLAPRANYLLKRWNLSGAQGNIYVSGGPAWRWTEGEPGFGALGALQADYETRRVYTQFNAEALQSEGDKDYHSLKLRLGVAPYLADYDGLQTFLIGQISYQPEMEDEWSGGPLIRLFYKSYLLELGIHDDGDLFVNSMIHY